MLDGKERMKNNYHIFQNGTLSRRDDTLLVTTEDNEKTHIPVERVEAVYTHGQLDFNTRLASFLNDKGAEIHIFGWNGRYSGSYVPKRGQVSGKTVVEQVSAYNSDIDRRRLAAKIVSASIENMRRNLIYYDRNSNDEYDGVKKLESIKSKAVKTRKINELLGVEAEARTFYYDVFRREIDGFQFNKREYNPPSNEINALISYLNSLVYTNCLSAIRKTALDPTISFLHEPGERRYSLSLDIADLFKPLLVDRLVIRILNRGQLSADDFRHDVDGCLLTERGRKVAAKEIEEEFEKTVEHPDLNRKVSYQYMLQLEAYALKKHLLTNEAYEPFVKWW